MERNLSGIYFRIKRGDKWVNIDLTDMTDEEVKEVCKAHTEEWLVSVIKRLCEVIKTIGEQFDIMADYDWEE